MAAERHFDQTAEGWDAASDEYARLFAPFTAQFAEEIIRLYPPQSADAVIEIAAGSGTLTQELAKRARLVLATDLSPRMIAHLEAGARTAGRSNVRAAVMDAQALDAADGAFDAAYCMFGAMFFPKRDLAFGEMARVLKSGGRCIVATWTPQSRLLAPVAAAMEKMMPGSPQAQALSAPPVLGTKAELTQELGAAGFGDIEVRHVTRTMRVPSRAVYVREFPRANPMGVMMEQLLPPPVFAALGAQIDAELAAEFGDGPVMLEGVANVARAVKLS
ncbi:MAG TPA: class I SAM-dependent methyltransferase [Candidatus Baltobacteraceae bacterium]|nr:class I SAM-dependent methyltransferase [Candidatus Baltobacteraceae bacterium]